MKSNRESVVSMDCSVTLAEQGRGLDWVHWLMRSLRHKCDGIVLERPETKTALVTDWKEFVNNRFMPLIAPVLVKTFRALAAKNMDEVRAQEGLLESKLKKAEADRSRQAGTILLARTRGARHQGVLGLYRESVKKGESAGHVAIAWPAVAHLFQLSIATMLAEYLRLEWETAAREMDNASAPTGMVSIPRVVEAVLSTFPEEPQVVKKKRVG